MPRCDRWSGGVPAAAIPLDGEDAAATTAALGGDAVAGRRELKTCGGALHFARDSAFHFAALIRVLSWHDSHWNLELDRS